MAISASPVHSHASARRVSPFAANTIGWLGLPLLAILNGAIREGLLKRVLDDGVAGLVSVASLSGLTLVYATLLQRRWPLRSSREALRVGVLWLTGGIAFEFGFGHYVEGDSWSKLLSNYNVFAGRTWIIVLVAVTLAPLFAYRRRTSAE